MPNEIVGRLLKFREHFMVQDKPVPKAIRLNGDKVKQLTDEILRYYKLDNTYSILPGLIMARMVLGMRIIEVTDALD